MANETHLEILLKGEETWNRWRKENPETLPDLRGTDFAKLLKPTLYWREERQKVDFGEWVVVGHRISVRDLDLRHTRLEDCDFSGIRFVRTDFRHARLDRSSISRVEFVDCYFERCFFWSTDGERPQFIRGNMKEAVFRNSKFRHPYFASCLLADSSCTDGEFLNAVFSYCEARNGEFRNSDFSGAQLGSCDFGQANFSGSNFTQASIKECSFRNANFDRTNLSNASVMDCSIRGSSIRSTTWNGTHILGLVYKMSEFDGQTYGLSVTNITGDAVFFRRLLDQIYLDTIRADIRRSRPLMPKRGSSDWLAGIAPIILCWRILMSGLFTPWPIIAGFAGVALMGVARHESMQWVRSIEGSHSIAIAVRLFFQGAIPYAFLISALVGTIAASWLGRPIAFWAWSLFDYGRSWVRVGLFAVASIGLFGAAYAVCGSSIHYLHVGPTVSGVFYPWFVASMGFATLGISDLIEPLDLTGQLLMIGNVLSGFVTLGLLMAVLANSFARRA
jgi:uncharacterized protein YjbI with pentapeptide repeats